MDLIHGLNGLTERKFQIDPIGKAQPHDVGIVFLVFEGGCPLGE